MKRLLSLISVALLGLIPALAGASSTVAPSIWIPPVVNARGRQIDNLYWIILVIVCVIFFITEGLLLFSVIYFRARPGRKAQFFHGSTTVELILATIPALILLYITLSSSRIWTAARLRPPQGKDVVKVQVFGEQFAWNFRYPGPDAVFGTADDVLAFGEMVLPEGKDVYFHISSKDVIHSFFLPESRLKQDAVPGLLTKAWTNYDHLPVWDLQSQKRVLLTPEEYAAADIAVSGYKFISAPARKKAGWYQASDSAKINYLEYSYARDAEAPLKVIRGGQLVKAEPRYVQHYFEIACAQLCGTSHFAMRGTVRVVPDAEFRAWLGAQTQDSFLAEKWNGIWDKYHPEFNRAL